MVNDLLLALFLTWLWRRRPRPAGTVFWVYVLLYSLTRGTIEFWDLTNRQDWELCERAQAGASSRGYRPGPYQSSEDCVHAFDRWYAGKLTGWL